MLSLLAAGHSFCADSPGFRSTPRPGTMRLAPLVSLLPFSFVQMTLHTAPPAGRGPPLGLITSPEDVPSLIVERHWREIPIVGDLLGIVIAALALCLPTVLIGLAIAALAREWPGASIKGRRVWGGGGGR